jgi:hypothetical protein
MIHFAACERPYAERLQAVLDVFAPATRRERGIDVTGVATRIHVGEDDWELTYRSLEAGVQSVAGAPPHSLGILLPTGDLEKAKERIVRPSVAFGAPVTRAVLDDGQPIWTDLVQPR